jgi:acetylornithine deacetylase/succinyl-diaminopimelate desuccinylase-like protein
MNLKVNCAIDFNMHEIVSDLQTLIRQPSSAYNKQNLLRCAQLVVEVMTKSNIKAELIYLDDNGGDGVPPIVFGEVKSRSNPSGKTILFYNHYDVQPEGLVEMWDNADPFSGRIDGNYIFGRGSSDDKGELIARIKAVEYYLKETGDVPCNIKFIVEGEEEIGSLHIQEFLNKYKKKFACDGIIWEFGFVDSNDTAFIHLGVKGILSVDLVAKGPSHDVHSSLAVLIENPTWVLVRALGTICDNNGRILINHWYDDVRSLSEDETHFVKNEPFDKEDFRKEYGITKFANNLRGIKLKEALVVGPTSNICALLSGYVGQGAKTVLPAEAKARLEFRLVPNMVPDVQLDRLRNYLTQKGFANTIKVKKVDGEYPARTPVNDNFVRIVKRAATEIFSTVIISISSAGSGPMYHFRKLLKAPCVCIGGSYKFNRSHSHNEFARLDLVNKTTKCMSSIIEEYGTDVR